MIKNNRLVIRLRRVYWSDRKGVYSKCEIIFLKRKSSGYNILEEDTSMFGANEIFQNIINLNTCKDGIYEVKLCNISTDFETGYLDAYDYELVSIETDKENINDRAE